MARTRNATPTPSSTNGVPYSTDGDFAGQGDTRNALHAKTLPKRQPWQQTSNAFGETDYCGGITGQDGNYN
jgi:hypothetical protein